MSEKLSQEQFQKYLKNTPPYLIGKCMRVAGSQPAYYFVEQLNYGDRYIVFYPDENLAPIEITRKEFFNRYETSPPDFNKKLLEKWDSFPEYSSR